MEDAIRFSHVNKSLYSARECIRTVTIENLYIHIYCVGCIKHFQVPLQRDTIVVIILVKITPNLRIYGEVTGYLLQTYFSKKLVHNMNSCFKRINV